MIGLIISIVLLLIGIIMLFIYDKSIYCNFPFDVLSVIFSLTGIFGIIAFIIYNGEKILKMFEL